MANDILFYETVGDLYYHRYLRLRPGKSEPVETGRDSNCEENQRQFNSWMRNGEAFADAIHRIIRLDDECRKAEAEVERLLASVKGYDKALSDAAARSEQQDREVWSLRDEVERLRALCAEAAKTLRSSTHFDNCDCGCVHEAELHGRLIDAAGRGDGE